uniref:Uncharacterized protein n=1 Tax=Ascaris lumbricoides TaxID=6252 RepID=A0A0M3IWM6_ASCLU
MEQRRIREPSSLLIKVRLSIRTFFKSRLMRRRKNKVFRV